MSLPKKYTELGLFCDNCSGQNKNQSLSRFLLYLTDSGRFKKIQKFFSLRGHSFLPCDRDFGTISKTLRQQDRIYTLHEVTNLIIQSAKPGKFQVKEVSTSDILIFKI